MKFTSTGEITSMKPKSDFQCADPFLICVYVVRPNKYRAIIREEFEERSLLLDFGVQLRLSPLNRD